MITDLNLQKTAVLPSASSTLNPHSYIELLPSIWALLLASPDISSTTDTSLFESLVQHYMRLSASSGVKKLAFEFIFRIVLVGPTYRKLAAIYEQMLNQVTPHSAPALSCLYWQVRAATGRDVARDSSSAGGYGGRFAAVPVGVGGPGPTNDAGNWRSDEHMTALIQMY